MVLTEYDSKKHIQNEKEISREEGRTEGGKQMLFELVKDGVLDID